MPFSKSSDYHTEDYWDKFFKEFIKPSIGNFGYSCDRSKALPTNIVKNIVNELCEADLVLAILTDFNSNVWYELGIRHSLKKGTIMMIEKGQKIPFDTTQYGAINYTDSLSARSDFEEQLKAFIEVIEKDGHMDNPVQEFLANQMNSKHVTVFEDYNAINWQVLFSNCTKLDICVHYFDTFIRNHRDLFASIFQRGGSIRIILPNYNNSEVVKRILRRFPEYQLSEIKTKIKQTKYKIETIKEEVGNPKSKFEAFFTNEIGYYCGLKFNKDKLVLSFYDHIRDKQKIESPTILVQLQKNKKIGKWFEKEFNGLTK